MLAAALLVASVLFLAWVRVASLHLGYELGQLRAEQDALMQDARALQVEIGVLRSPARLAELARSNLHMVPAQAAHILAEAPP
jgi:cell division protein FtsL